MPEYNKKTWTRERLYDTDLENIENGIENNALNTIQYGSGTPSSVTTVDENNSFFIDSSNDDLYYHNGTDWIKVSISNDSLNYSTITLNGGNAINSIGRLSLGDTATISVATGSIQTDELDLTITPTWSNLHTFNSGIEVKNDIKDDIGNILFDYSEGKITNSVVSDIISHNDLSDAGSFPSDSHHIRYADSEAVSAVDGEVTETSTTVSGLDSSTNTHIGASNPHSDSASDTDLSNHTTNTSNPHSVSYSQTGAASDSHDNTSHSVNFLSDITNEDLSELSDVDSNLAETSGEDGYALVWNNSEGHWESGNHPKRTDNPHSVSYDQTGAASDNHDNTAHSVSFLTDITSESIGDLNNVNVNQTSSEDGYHLTWDNTNSEWIEVEPYTDTKAIAAADSEVSYNNSLSELDSNVNNHIYGTNPHGIDSVNWDDYTIEKNGSDESGVINFKT